LVQGNIYLLPFTYEHRGVQSTTLNTFVTSIQLYPSELQSAFHGKHKTDCGQKPVYKLTFEDSIFHPQGGGQPSDVGIVEMLIDDGILEFNVIFAQKGMNGIVDNFGVFNSDENIVNDKISFALEACSNSNTCAIPATLRLNFEKRTLHTRIHSAGHAIDEAVNRCASKYGIKMVPMKGYHFIDGPYVEYQLSEGSSDPSDVLLTAFVNDMNQAMNDIILEDIPTTITIEPIVDGGFNRIVTLAGLACPCGGTHVKSTAELQTVTITKAKKKKNIVKISYLLP